MRQYIDYCRVGSLEMMGWLSVTVSNDYCRVGSLETNRLSTFSTLSDYCRVGSLEIMKKGM